MISASGCTPLLIQQPTKSSPFGSLRPEHKLTERFLTGLQEKHDVADAVFLVDSAPWLHAALYQHGFRFQTEAHGDRDSAEHIFKMVH